MENDNSKEKVKDNPSSGTNFGEDDDFNKNYKKQNTHSNYQADNHEQDDDSPLIKKLQTKARFQPEEREEDKKSAERVSQPIKAVYGEEPVEDENDKKERIQEENFEQNKKSLQGSEEKEADDPNNNNDNEEKHNDEDEIGDSYEIRFLSNEYGRYSNQNSKIDSDFNDDEEEEDEDDNYMYSDLNRDNEEQKAEDKETQNLNDVKNDEQIQQRAIQRQFEETRADPKDKLQKQNTTNPSSLKAQGGKEDSSKSKKKGNNKQAATDNLKSHLEKKEDTIKEAVNKRKKVRFAVYFLYLAIIAITTGICFTRLIEKDTIEYPASSAFEFELENCTLLISDHADSDIASPVYVKYNVPRELGIDEGSEVTTSTEGNTRTILVRNIFEPRYCLVNMFVKQGTQLRSLTITCPRCNVTQDNSFQLEVNGALTIDGQIINANFRNVKVGSLIHRVTTGYLQLNNIETSSAANTITVENEGDILIQSTQDLKVDLSTPTHTFCFKAPVVMVQNSTGCAFSGQNVTGRNLNNVTCNIISNICSSSSECLPTTKYTIFSNISNVYANQISSVGIPVAEEGQLLKGYIYDKGLGFGPRAKEVLSNFNTLASDPRLSNPFVMLNLGDYGSRSSRFTRWTISSAPSYAYMKPWWVSTMSGTVLNGYIEQVDGFLFPGLCPFIPEYTTENLFEVQTLISNSINSLTALITFVNDDTTPLPSSSTQPSTGIFSYGQPGNPFDRWLNLVRLQNGNIILENNDYTKKGEILAAIILSLLIAAYIAILVMELTIVSINMMYEKLVNFANHLDSYSKLEQSKIERELEEKKLKTEPKKVIHTKFTLGNILKNSPSPSAFIDYLSLILYRQFSSSVAQYYHLLFKKVNESEIQDQELDPTKDMLKGTDAKILYEKFCFMNHLYEQKLTDKPNLAILKKYGFDIVTREDLVSEVFTKINIKNYDNFLVSPPKEGEDLNSLKIYFDQNVDVTEFQEDQMEVDTFTKLYQNFCDYNRLPRLVISPSVMKEKFNISISVVPQQFIMRKLEEEDDFRQNHTDLWLKIVERWERLTSKKKKTIYAIDTSKLENHFKLVMNKLSELEDKQLQNATVDLILYPQWWLWDAITVLIHILVGAIITLPLIGVVIINESEYQPWSLKDPLKLISFMDIVRDPANLIVKLYSCFTWNVIIVILITVFWVLNCFDILLYYAVMEFPQDKSFKKSEVKGETFWHKLSRQFEWVLMLLTLSFYFGYIGLVLTWLLLGALINPNAFLPYASAALTFVTFVTTKYKTFKNLANQGTKAVMDYLKKLFDGFTNKLLGKLTQSMEQTAGSLAEKGKSFLESEKFKSATEKLAETGIIDAKYIVEYTEKIKNLDGKTIVGGATAIATDPSIILKEAENFANSLKEKAIEKVKEECKKRGIPPSLVSLIISITLKDNKQTKENLMSIVKECNKNLKLPPESVEIIVELLFPQGLNREELVMFVTTKIITIVFDVFDLNEVQGLTPEVLIDTFNNLKNLQDLKLDTFVNGLKVLLTSVKEKIGIKELEFLLPALEIASIVSQSGVKLWKLKTPALKLLNSAVTLLSKDSSSENAQLVNDLVKFFSIVSSGDEVPCDITTGQPLEGQDVFRVIDDLSSSLGFDNGEKEKKKLAPCLIYLAIMYTRQETHDMSKEFFKEFEKVLELNVFGRNDYLSFCFNLANMIFNTPDMFHQRIQKCISSFGFDKELMNFLKIISCYSLEDKNNNYKSPPAEKNEYFIKMAHMIKISPSELLGIIDFIYKKKNYQHIDAFLTVILKRMNVSTDTLDTLKQVIELLLSNDEGELLKVIKILHLDYGQFLLMGKGILNPRYISKKDFEEVGIKESTIIDDKETIAGSSADTFEFWKTELKGKINNTPSNPKVGSLVNVYLSDWNTFSYSKKSLFSVISALDNEKNDLKNKLSQYSKGSSYNGIDFLVTILSLQDLNLVNGKKFPKLDREKENAVLILVEYLSVEAESLRNFLKLFLIDDFKTVLNSFLFFFPKEKANQEVLQKVLTFSFKQANIIKNQVEFISNKLSSTIELPFLEDTKFSLPKGLFTQIFYSSKGSMNINDLLDLAYLMLRKFIDKEKHPMILPEYYKELYMVGRFAKGFLTQKDISNKLGIFDHKIQKLVFLLSQPDQHSRMVALTELFEDRNHPIKIAIAFYGLFTRKYFKIRHLSQKANVPIKSQETPTPPQKPNQSFEEEPIKNYLASLFNVYPEAFDLFELTFERNITNFIQKALPLIRRITDSSFVDANQFESLFSLSLGEHFNVGYLANRLDISPDYIEFFVTITRLATSQHIRKKELILLPDSIPVQKVLTKLKVKAKELVALTRLVFGLFETDADIVDMLTNIGLIKKKNESKTKEIIEVELFKGFAALNTSIDLESDIYKLREVLIKERSATVNFFNSLGLSTDDDIAFIISRLAAGNFLILDEYKQQIDWAFPNNDSVAEVAIKSLTMGLCGLLNPNIEMTNKTDEQVKNFVEAYYPKKDQAVFFKEVDHDHRKKALPDNSLAYAIYLIYYSIDIPPCWTQLFFFNKQMFEKVEKKLPDITKEFLLSLVLSFASLPEIGKDFIGLFDWNMHCYKFYTKVVPKEEQRGLENDSEYDENLYKFFFEQLNFEYERTLAWANEYEVFQENKALFAKVKCFNSEINSSLLYLLTLGHENEKDIRKKFQDHRHKTVSQFLSELGLVLLKKDKYENINKQRIEIGKMVQQAIITVYKEINKAFYPNREERYEGFELTDLSILGTTILLRSKPEMAYERMLYNMHQLTMNIERKVYLDENFSKMSKFKLMKLAGISLGVQISNIVEWCLPPSLFTQKYVKALSEANTEGKMKIKAEYCLNVAFKSNIILCDLGMIGGSYEDYMDSKENLQRIDSWEAVQLFLGLSFKYLGDPQGDNELKLAKLANDDMFNECKTQNKQVYHSRELVSLIYDPNKPKKNIVQEQEQQKKKPEETNPRNKSKEPVKQTSKKEQKKKKELEAMQDIDTRAKKQETIDIKTGISFANLERKAEEFEEILTDPNMNLIQGIIRGDPSIVLKGDHIISKGDQNNNKTKIYMALLGLQSCGKNHNKDKKKFKEYLSIIAQSLESDLPKLEELLTFFITKRPNLNDCVSVLEISENLVDLMLMKVKRMNSSKGNKGKEEEEDDEEEEIDKFSIFKAIKNTLPFDEKSLEVFKILRSIYQYNINSWTAAVRMLVKNSKEKENNENYNLDLLTVRMLVKNSKEKENNENYNLDLLIKLINMIDLKKIKRESYNSSLPEIHQFFKTNISDVFMHVFKEIILALKHPSTTTNTNNLGGKRLYNPKKLEQEIEKKKKQEFLIESYKVIQCMINLDLSQLFAMLVLTDEEKDESLFKKMLKEFGVNWSDEKGIKLLKVFITLANGSLTAFKTLKGYESVIDKIAQDMVDSDLLKFLGDEKIQKKVAQLILGVLGCDLQLIATSFITEETLKEGYFLYHILGCLRLDRLMLTKRKDVPDQINTHLEVLFIATVKKITSKIVGEVLLSDLFKDMNFDRILKDASEKMELKEFLKHLESKVKELLKEKPPSNRKGGVTKILANCVIRSPDEMNASSEGSFNIMKTICDGSILNTLARFHSDSLEKFIQFILKLEKSFTADGNPTKNLDVINNFKKFYESLTRNFNKSQKISISTDKSLIDKFLEYYPDVMKIFLAQGDRMASLNSIKVNVIFLIQKIIREAKSSDKAVILFDLVNVVMGLSVDKFSPDDPLRYDLGPSEKMNLFFSKILPAIFTGLPKNLNEELFETIYQLIRKMRTDFMNNFKDPQKLRETVKSIAILFGSLQHFLPEDKKSKFIQPEFINALVSLLDGNLEGIRYLMPIIKPNISHDVDKIVKYLEHAQSVLGLDFENKLLKEIGSKDGETKSKKIDADSWASIMKKIKEGTASSRDLFKVIDEAGDHSGSISENEFALLANRLGIKLSKHRIKEIFAKIKGEKARETSESELNEKEFEQALEYLQTKNLQQALQMLGITPEILTAILIQLVILLILIFFFIFLGIRAFALGGTFGAVINSLFPAVGGIGLGKQNDDEKDKLTAKSVEKASETGFEITTSEQI